MFNYFSKPVGIYLRDEAVTLVQLKKDKAVPLLETVIHKAIPKGVMVDGEIKDPKALLPILKGLQDTVKSAKCVIALPVSKTYSGLLKMPKEIDGEALEEAIRAKINSVLPIPISELYYQKSVVRSEEKGTVYVFILGVEKSILDSYTKIFKAAGCTKLSFVLETLALAKAIPLKFAQYPRLMFIHSFGAKALMSNVYKGNAFDGFYSTNIAKDFVHSYQSYIQQIGSAPTHIILSGDREGLAPLGKLVFNGPKPKFVSAKFLVEMENGAKQPADLIVSTGLSLSDGLCAKYGGRCLLNLLD